MYAILEPYFSMLGNKFITAYELEFIVEYVTSVVNVTFFSCFKLSVHWLICVVLVAYS